MEHKQKLFWKGDTEFYDDWVNSYTIDCTGDCCTGDVVVFQRAIFEGSFRNPKFLYMETIRGTIIKDSYGKEKQQHTFTIETWDKKKIRIKGRNLYKNGTLRKVWDDENKRLEILDEKHERGTRIREQRDLRRRNNNGC